MQNIEAGQGFELVYKGQHRYGLVLSVQDDAVRYVDVVSACTEYQNLKSYDEDGAVYDRDKDNVRLKDCPPPFSALGKMSVSMEVPRKSNSMAMADMDDVSEISLSLLLERGNIVDNGVKISERDMYRVYNHPWPFQKEKEKTMQNPMNKRYRDLPSSFLDAERAYDSFGRDYDRQME